MKPAGASLRSRSTACSTSASRKQRAPSYGLSTVTWQGKPDHVFQWVLFPLGDGDVVTHCLSLDDLSVIAPRSRLLPLGGNGSVGRA